VIHIEKQCFCVSGDCIRGEMLHMSAQSEIPFQIQLCYNADVLHYGLNQALAVLQLALRDIEETGSLLGKWKKTE
jgi:hypothetical protein